MQRGPRRPFHRSRLRYDAGYRIELGYCYDHGIPWSRYLEEFSQEDRARVMAFATEKAERCQLCGTAEWEWLENKFAYHAAREVCFGCQQKDLLREEETGQQPGVSITLIPGPAPVPEKKRKAE